MKKIYLSIIVVSFINLSSIAFSSNGIHRIGHSTASLGMGGTSVGSFVSLTDSMVRNASTLSLMPGDDGSLSTQLDFHVAKNNVKGVSGTTAVESKSGAAVFPELGIAYKFSKKFAAGLALVEFGGASTDFVNDTAALQLKSSLAMIRIAPAATYEVFENFRFGISPFLNYGRLALNHASNLATGAGAQTTRDPKGATALGFHAGMSNAWGPVTVGAGYTSKSTLTYDSIVDLDAFGPAAVGLPGGSAATLGTLDSFKQQQPDEYAVGVSWNATDAFKLAFDYRLIHWRGSETYTKLGWDDQSVIALGAQYKFDKLSVRTGFNYGKSPLNNISGQAGLTSIDFEGHTVFASSLSRLSAYAIPIIAQTHLSGGLGYAFSEKLDLNTAFVYVFENTRTFAGTTSAAYSFATTVSQWSASLGAAYRF